MVRLSPVSPQEQNARNRFEATLTPQQRDTYKKIIAQDNAHENWANKADPKTPMPASPDWSKILGGGIQDPQNKGLGLSKSQIDLFKEGHGTEYLGWKEAHDGSGGWGGWEPREKRNPNLLKEPLDPGSKFDPKISPLKLPPETLIVKSASVTDATKPDLAAQSLMPNDRDKFVKSYGEGAIDYLAREQDAVRAWRSGKEDKLQILLKQMKEMEDKMTPAQREALQEYRKTNPDVQTRIAESKRGAEQATPSATTGRSYSGDERNQAREAFLSSLSPEKRAEFERLREKSDAEYRKSPSYDGKGSMSQRLAGFEHHYQSAEKRWLDANATPEQKALFKEWKAKEGSKSLADELRENPEIAGKQKSASVTDAAKPDLAAQSLMSNEEIKALLARPNVESVSSSKTPQADPSQTASALKIEVPKFGQ